MSQRPLFLDNLYNRKRQQRIKCFLRGCKIIFITGATVMIVSSLAVLGAHDVANRTKQSVFNSKNTDTKPVQQKNNKTVVYPSQNHR